MGSLGITGMWEWAWEKHDQTKVLLKSAIKPHNIVKEYTERQQQKEETVQSEKNSNEQKGTEFKQKRSYTTAQMVGLFLGPLLFALTLTVFQFEGLSNEAQSILASTLWVATWWVTEAIPIPATSLLPLLLFPLTGALEMKAVTAPYADNIIFLIMGGFVIALAMEKWNLHKRIALNIVLICGTSIDRVLLGFVASTGLLSMWISNTAATMLMVPIGMAIVYQVAQSVKDDPSIDTTPINFKFGKAMMLAIAYSASMGGLGTMIGSPANAILVAIVNQLYGVNISFAQWMMFGVPISLFFLFIIWFYLSKIAFPTKIKELPGGLEYVKGEKKDLGKMSPEEKVVLTVFTLTALAWVTRSFFLVKFIPHLNDAMIAVAAALVLFVLPSKSKQGERIFDWESGKKLPWGIFLMYGCGLAIASGFVSTGLSDWLGVQMTSLDALPVYVVLTILVAFILALTELTSNGATATMMYPIMGSLALALDVHPYVFIVAACLAASSAFMMPVSTPPNAVVFGTGYLRIKDMVKAGVVLNIAMIILIPLVVYFLLPLVWGFDGSFFPENFK